MQKTINGSGATDAPAKDAPTNADTAKDAPAADTAKDAPANADTTKTEPKTFTQEEVNAMMAKEKNQGKNAAFSQLGIDPKDAQAIVTIKAFVEGQNKSKQAAGADADVLANNAAMAEATQRAALAEAKVEAMMLGVKSEYVDDVIIIALSKASEENDLKTVLGEMKTKYPVWFGMTATDDDKKPEKKVGTGSSFKTADKNKTENDSIGARLAANRKVQNKPKSYWN